MSATYVVRRVLTLLVTLFVVAIVTFLVFEVIPGDPILTMLGPDADPALVAAMQAEYGTDRPLPERLASWFAGVVTGDLGTSIRFSRPVASLILDRVVISLMIALLSIVIIVVVAIPLGVFLAIRRRHWSEPLVSMGIQIGMAIPSFWLGIILISVFGLMLRMFPTGGFVPPAEGILRSLHSVMLPSVAISIPLIAVVVRYTRNSVIDQLSHDYVRTARSKGFPVRTVIFRHVVRNASLPVITVLGMVFSNVIVGTIIIEQVFALPGLGLLLVNAVSARDFPLIQGLVLYITFAVAFLNLLVDLAYHVIDPRIEVT
jgi:peptide/nickel transport system permease protein